jgi:hypothetical protein
MAGDVNASLFMEDPAQESFLLALVTRVATEIGIQSQRLNLDVRNASGGRGQAMSSFRRFVRDFVDGGSSAAFVVVAIDSDCRPRHDVADDLRELAQRAGYPGPVVPAVPVPHIERWYTLDRRAFRDATSGANLPSLPESCERNYCKQAIIDALREADIISPLAATPYAEEYVAAMDINLARQSDGGFDSFYGDLRQCLAAYRAN